MMSLAASPPTPTHYAANELGWSDLTGACDGLHHTQCPVEATRIYNNRWHTFLKTYLAKGPSPIGDITRVWFRQEDQVQQLHPCSILHALLSSPTSPADVHKVHAPMCSHPPRSVRYQAIDWHMLSHSRREAPFMFMLPSGSIQRQSRRTPSLAPPLERMHALHEHSTRGASSFSGCAARIPRLRVCLHGGISYHSYDLIC